MTENLYLRIPELLLPYGDSSIIMVSSKRESCTAAKAEPDKSNIRYENLTIFECLLLWMCASNEPQKWAQALRSPVNLGNSNFGNRADETSDTVDFSSESPGLGKLVLGVRDVFLASRNCSLVCTPAYTFPEVQKPWTWTSVHEGGLSGFASQKSLLPALSVSHVLNVILLCNSAFDAGSSLYWPQ